MAKRKVTSNKHDLDSGRENYDRVAWVNAIKNALGQLHHSDSEEKKIYDIYEIAQYFGLQYENPDLFAQESPSHQVAILHHFFLNRLTPSLIFHQDLKNPVSIGLLKNEFTNRNTQLNVFDIFHGDPSDQQRILENFIARITDLIREVPTGIVRVGLRSKQAKQRSNINLAVDIFRALDPNEENMQLLNAIVLRSNEQEGMPELDALADLIIHVRKLPIPYNRFTKENTSLTDIYSLLNQ